MNIQFVFKDFVCSGGVERVQYNLAKQFLNDGHNVVFYILNKDEPYPNLDARIEVVNRNKTGVFSLLSEVNPLRKYLECNKIDLVISAKEQANIVTFCASLFCKVIPIFTRHSALDVSEQQISKSLVSGLYGLYSLGKGKIVAVSEQLKSDLAASMLWGQSKVTSCANPVVSQDMLKRSTEDVEVFRQHAPYICTVGRLTQTKGYDTLIRAYAAYSASTDGLGHKLVIAGDGEDRVKLQQLSGELGLDDKIIFVGHIENPYALMKNSDGFILSSRNEGLPTVLIEAIALGVNVVSTDCPTGPREILDGGRIGTLIPVDCISSMASSIETLITGQLTDVEVSSMNKYSHEASAQQYYETYMEAK